MLVDIDAARLQGAPLQEACVIVGIGLRTYRRWKAGGDDGRPLAARPEPAHKRSRSVWYRYTPSGAQTVTVDTFGSDYEVSLSPGYAEAPRRRMAGRSLLHMLIEMYWRGVPPHHAPGRGASPRHLAPPGAGR